MREQSAQEPEIDPHLKITELTVSEPGTRHTTKNVDPTGMQKQK